jgi:hypothetical protein
MIPKIMANPVRAELVEALRQAQGERAREMPAAAA